MLKILKTFYSFLFKKRLIAVMFLVVLTASPIIASIQPFFYKEFVDSIPNLDFDYLFKVLVAYIALRIVLSLVNTSRWYIADHLLIDSWAEVKETVFSYIHKLDFSFHSNKSSGSLISAIKRGDGAYWNIHHSIHFRLYDTLVSFIVMVIVFAELDSRILIYILFALILSVFYTILFVKFNIKYRTEVNDEEDKISGIIVDNMINFETVKLFANELKELLKLKKVHHDWKKVVWKQAYTFRGLDLGMMIIVNGSLFLITLVSLQNTVNGLFTVGDFILVITFLHAFYPKLWEVVWGVRDFAKSYTDIERYFGILDNAIEVKDPENPIRLKNVEGEIAFKHVSFTYAKKQKDAIKNMDLTIRQGQSVAFVGRSGAGKTTLVKLLLRFFDVDEGEILVDGINIKDIKKSDLRSHIGVVPQEPILFNNTIRYNIAYGADNPSWNEIKAASKMANIDKFIQSLPKKYNTNVGERGIKLSGGQKQRLAIARMILSDPEIIVFDEATSQLDSHSEKLIQDAFWKVSKNKTTLIIAHRLSTIVRADKIVVLKNGRIIESGSHNEPLNKHGSLYSHFWQLQTSN